MAMNSHGKKLNKITWKTIQIDVGGAELARINYILPRNNLDLLVWSLEKVNRKSSPKWWFFMVIYHGIESIKQNHLTENKYPNTKCPW